MPLGYPHTALSHWNEDRLGYPVLLPHVVAVNDCTLREGEQGMDSPLTMEARRDIARALASCGVDQLQVGVASLIPTEQERVKTILDLGLDTPLEVLVFAARESWAQDLAVAAAWGVRVNVVLTCADLRLGRSLPMSRDEVRRRVTEVVGRAADMGLSVTYTPADTTRSDFDFLATVIKSAEQAGADRVVVADTAGVTWHAGMNALVTRIRQHTRLPIGVHCHNDFGLAVANSLAAVAAGADMVDVTIDGIGERSGGASLAETAASLKWLLGVEVATDLTRMRTLSSHAARLTGRSLPRSAPLVGEDAFRHRFAIHHDEVLTNPRAFEGIEPSLVGNQRHLGPRRETEAQQDTRR